MAEERHIKWIMAESESSIPSNLKEHETRVSGQKERIPSQAFKKSRQISEFSDRSKTTPSNDHYDNSEQFDKTAIEPRYKGGNIPSHAFKILQEMTGTSEGEPLQTTFQPNRRTSEAQDHTFEFKKSQIELKPEVPASQLPNEPEPKKYTGGKIPSRSFRLLQTLTGEDSGKTGHEGTDF
ncbi:uncharacterized protein LOC143229418 [Tachypleus tridentatus]|uniref:uncharacterized protein LOC143229418 n=1 Tax=Tachypleus tridentatus TaxID=6853 RepID=UPI003FD22732